MEMRASGYGLPIFVISSTSLPETRLVLLYEASSPRGPLGVRNANAPKRQLTFSAAMLCVYSWDSHTS